MLTNDALNYLGGLVDGEGYLGVYMWKESKKNYTFGYGVRPVFQIALGFPDSLSLKYFQQQTGLGEILPNRKSGHHWIVRKKEEVIEILNLIKQYVRFPSTQRKIELILEFLSIMPNKRPCTREIWQRELEIIIELRRMSKRKLNPKRHNVEEILARFSPIGVSIEAVNQSKDGESMTLSQVQQPKT